MPRKSIVNKTGATGCKIPSRNVFIESLPNYGFVSLEKNMYVWYGHKRGSGRECAVVCWSGTGARAAQEKLDGLVDKFKRFGHIRNEYDFKANFGVRP